MKTEELKKKKMFESSLTYYFYVKATDEVIECNFERWQELAKKHGPCQVVKQDTRAIQHYLGHKSITSTVIYTHLDFSRFNGFFND